MNAIELDGVTLGFRGRHVLRDVSLSIRAGEFVGVLGPNGAGKTTLLRAILGLVQARAGSVRVFGAAVRRGDGRIGYMPQVRSHLAGPRITGAEFVASAADGVRWGLPWPSRAVGREVDAALALVDGETLARRPLMQLSGGERQRLLLAQALLGRPKLLLLDEPLMSLDVRHQRNVVLLVRRLQRELGLTVVFTAHEVNALIGTMDRVLYLGGGQAAIGTVDEVMTGPVLSRLYGAEIEVVRAGGRVFVMMGGHEAEHGAHGCEGTHVHV